MKSDELLDSAAELIYDKLDTVGGDPLQLPAVLQPIAILYTIQAIVDNGGFRYLFENDRGSHPYSVWVQAYRQVGAMHAADCLERAVNLFPFPDPHINESKRNEYMDSLNEESAELYQLGDQVCGDRQVWLLMEAYVKDHLAELAECGVMVLEGWNPQKQASH